MWCITSEQAVRYFIKPGLGMERIAEKLYPVIAKVECLYVSDEAISEFTTATGEKEEHARL